MNSSQPARSAGRLSSGTPHQDATGIAGNDPSVSEALRRSLKEDDSHRLNLARRLHKDVAGNLVACTAVSEMIRHQLIHGGDHAGITGMLASIDGALRQTLQIVREITEEQLPPVLTAFGLSTALQQFVKQVGGGFSGSLVLHVKEEELGLDPLRRLNLFRILQTMIRRCVCDARASWVEVTCLAAHGQLECTIDHDGDASLWAGSGENGELATIKARCALLGCAFHATPSPIGSGLRTRLLVPQSAAAIGA